MADQIRDQDHPLRQNRFTLRTYRYGGDGQQQINAWYDAIDREGYGYSRATTVHPEDAPPIIQQILKLWNEYVSQTAKPLPNDNMADHEALLADMRSFQR
jgi:hypothetical protein